MDVGGARGESLKGARPTTGKIYSGRWLFEGKTSAPGGTVQVRTFPALRLSSWATVVEA